jgi:5-methylcytosine-specific restriction endonuclease McrA
MRCSAKRTRLLLDCGRTRVARRYPFGIRLVDRTVEESASQPVRIKLDPGSKTTGFAIVRDATGETVVLALAELAHRGADIRACLTARRAFRRRRRARLRYRQRRFDNRRRPEGWLAPSLRHRADTVLSWVGRLCRLAPVGGIAIELVRFDVQKTDNPEIAGILYQQGTSAGYEVRASLLEKWERCCASCDARNGPSQVAHVHPKARGRSNRINSLKLACAPCNDAEGSLPIEVFLADKPERLKRILNQARRPLDDAAAVNATRWILFNALKGTDLPIETSSGGTTEWTRARLDVPKTHATDATCVGEVEALSAWRRPILSIKATGRSAYERTSLDRFGLPGSTLMLAKRVAGFQTGEMVRAVIRAGKKARTYVGRVAMRASKISNIQTADGVVRGIHARHCEQLAHGDGDGYALARELLSSPERTGGVSRSLI